MSKKYVYFFGDGKADGNESMKNLLGGKGANLAEMAGNKDLRLPVPPGFTITTEVCTYYYQHKRSYPEGLREQAEKAVKRIEAGMALAIRKAKPCLAGLWLRLFGSRTLPAQQAGIALWLISLPE